MQSVHAASSGMITTAADASLIPAYTRSEAMEMAAVEMRRFIAVIESLSGDDWKAPTACTAWSVHDVVAHQAAHVMGFKSLKSFLAQQSPKRVNPYLKKGMSRLDAWNQSEVDLRKGYTPAQLVAEIRENADTFLKGRKNLPGLLLGIALPLPGFDQPRSFSYLFDLIYTRDMWMHRLDICNATGRSMGLDDSYDARTVALIMRDLGLKAKTALGGRSATLHLTGVAGGKFQIGGNSAPTTTITIDALVFAILTSGRSKAADVVASGQAVISGDAAFGREVIAYCENRVLY